jgi:uncharacterized membrane protein (UPF0127 family)
MSGKAMLAVRALSLALALLLFTLAVAEDLDEAFARDSLVIVASAGACYQFDVYLALTGEQQRRGLMFVRDLPAFTGMLFAYPEPGVRSMYMKKTFIPLDMLFIRSDGAVSSIAKQTEPQSLRTIASVEPVNYVLELNAGVTDTLGIDEHSRVLLPEDLSTDR